MPVCGDEVVPFHEIVPNATVRYTTINGIQYLSVRDIILTMCCNDECDNTMRKKQVKASRIWGMIPESFKSELYPVCQRFQFKGSGQSEQHVIQFNGALKLLMWLPGEQAKLLRVKATDILTRYFAGDETLISEIQANAESDGPINIAARAAVPALDDLTNKRQKLNENMGGELAVVRAVTASTSEYNVVLSTQIQIKQDLYKVEVDYHHSMLTHEQEMLKAKVLRSTHDISHEQEMLKAKVQRSTHDISHEQEMLKITAQRNTHDISREHEMLKITAQRNTHDISREHEMLKIMAQRNSLDLEYKRALKAIENESSNARAPTPTVPFNFNVNTSVFPMEGNDHAAVSMPVNITHVTDNASDPVLPTDAHAPVLSSIVDAHAPVLSSIVDAHAPDHHLLLDPSTYTTVLKVYHSQKSEFNGIPNSAIKKKFLISAGKKAAVAFRAKWGREPTRTSQDSLEVMQYPIDATDLILESLRVAYREILAGKNQPTLQQYHFNINLGGGLPAGMPDMTTGA